MDLFNRLGIATAIYGIMIPDATHGAGIFNQYLPTFG
jgi:hypothetical protein